MTRKEFARIRARIYKVISVISLLALIYGIIYDDIEYSVWAFVSLSCGITCHSLVSTDLDEDNSNGYPHPLDDYL